MVEITTDDLPPVISGGERHILQPREELRFEVAFGTVGGNNTGSKDSTATSNDIISFCLQKGSCELYGCELALNKIYSIPQGGIKVALFTWHGCVVDLWQGSNTQQNALEISYINDETDANVAFVNTHAQLEALRDDAMTLLLNNNNPNTTNNTNNRNNTTTTTTTSPFIGGPRVMVVGPSGCGKTTLVKTLVAYATKVGRTPLWVDLDPMDNKISVPGSLSVAPMTSNAVSVETYATSGIPPNTIHPLVLFHGSSSQIHPDLFKGQIDKLAVSINKRLQYDELANSSGIIVDTNGWIRDDGYDLLLYIANALRITVLLVLGHDRLYSMLTNHYKKIQQQQQEEEEKEKTTTNDDEDDEDDDDNDKTTSSTSKPTKSTVIIPKVLKLPRSGGVVSSPPSAFTRQCRSRAIRRYFYGDLIIDPSKSDKDGDSSTTLSKNKRIHQLTPFLVQIPFSDLKVYKLSSMALSSSLLPVAQSQSTDVIQIEQINMEEGIESLQHALLAVCHPSAVAEYEKSGTGRDLVTAGVAGFVVVERIVKETDQIHLLSPCAGTLPSKSLIVGDITWME